MSKVVKPVVFVLLLLPALLLVAGLYFDTLGANPPEYILHSTGEWALRLVILTLLLSSLKRVFNWYRILQLRRMIGLFTFFYASLHCLSYVWFEQGFSWYDIYNDVWQRPFITVGLTAFLCMIPLAVTSSNRMMRQMGRRWKRLHLLVYPTVILGVVHFWWLVKADITEPLIYAGLTAALFIERVWGKLIK